MLNITQTIANGTAVLSLAGRLDTVTAPELEQKLRDILPTVTALTLDCEKLEYISSAGLRVLLAAHKAFTEKGGMTVAHVSESIMEILEVTGFSDILTIE
ncbi:MAG: STAS domain-containing protein [Clostridia bacterium]|nr:STAS domain-containing protein [Clostridia bacterium]